jgi:hypothetical protein
MAATVLENLYRFKTRGTKHKRGHYVSGLVVRGFLVRKHHYFGSIFAHFESP